MKKADIQNLTAQEAMVLCNELGLPEGTPDEMRDTLARHFDPRHKNEGLEE